MAHNIAKIDGVDAVFTGAGVPAWHKLGKTIEGAATWSEAIQLAQLDWEVEKRVLFDRNQKALEAWGIFRTTDDAFLGTVGARYNNIQNREAFEFVDALIGDDGAHYDTAGALGNGEVIFCSASLPSAGFEVIPGDTHSTYLLFKTAHDGSSSAITKLTDVRTVCNNTLNMALSGQGAQFKIKHTNSAQYRMKLAADLVDSGRRTAEDIRDKLRQLAERQMTKPTMEDILSKLFPADKEGALSTKMENNVIEVLNYYESNDNNAFPIIRGTAYNLINAMIQYVDYSRTARGEGAEGMDMARATSSMFGSGELFKTKAFEYVYAEAAKLPLRSQPKYYDMAPAYTGELVPLRATPVLDSLYKRAEGRA